jgi:hypothetical protein
MKTCSFYLHILILIESKNSSNGFFHVFCDENGRDLSGAAIDFVSTTFKTNRHEFYWFLDGNLQLFDMMEGQLKKSHVLNR